MAGFFITLIKLLRHEINYYYDCCYNNRHFFLWMAFTIVKELGEQWRIGVEGSYNGYQYRQDASKTPGYSFMAGFDRKKNRQAYWYSIKWRNPVGLPAK